MPGRDDPVRVVHVTGCLAVGGQEKLLVEFARHADRRHFALRFLCLEGHGPLARDIEAEGWPVTALEVPPGLWPGLPFRLARLFRRWRTDVVHTHNERPLLYAAPAARLAGVRRVIHTRHGRGVGLSRRQVLLANLAARWADHYVCVSDDCARLSREQGMATSRVQRLWNGIDTCHFAFQGPRPDGPAVLVARLSPEEDVITLLHAVALLISQVPHFRLVIAGDGPCLPELQARVAELGLGGSVQFLGMVRDVAGLLGQARLYVLSSVSEGVSLTLLEAMARGLPVVATRVGGTPEVVLDQVTGLLVPPENPLALAEALQRITLDQGLACRMGIAGRQRVEAHFDIRRMVADYERMYVGPDQGWIEENHDAVLDTGSATLSGGGPPRRVLVAEAARH